MTHSTTPDFDALLARVERARWSEDAAGFRNEVLQALRAASDGAALASSEDAARYRKAFALGLIRNEVDKAEVDAILDASPDNVCA